MQSLENSMELSQKSKSKTILCSSSPTPGHIPGKDENSLIQRDSYTPVFRRALFIIAEVRKQPKCTRTNEWIRKICMYTMECYSAMKRMKFFFFFS